MQYHAPSSVEEASSLLAKAGDAGRILAGGTDLLVQLRAKIRRPEVVVDLKHVAETRTIVIDDDGVTLGAAVTCAEANEHAGFMAEWPGVAEALELIGSTQIQGRATAGGNLCNGSPAADSVPALVAANAVCVVAGPDGRREVPVEKIVTGPGKLSLANGELVVAFKLPRRKPRSGDAYLRFIPRTEMDIAVVGVGVNLTLDADGTCTYARVSLGAVAPTQLVVDEAAAALVGSKVDDDALAKLAAAASAACKPIDDKRGTVEFRVKVAGVLAKRAALIAAERARSN